MVQKSGQKSGWFVKLFRIEGILNCNNKFATNKISCQLLKVYFGLNIMCGTFQFNCLTEDEYRGCILLHSKKVHPFNFHVNDS